MSKIQARIDLLTARIAKDTSELTELYLQRDAELALQNVQAGDVCTFKFGRKDSRTVLRGTVVATDEANAKLRVYAGEGFDAQLYTIATRDVLGVGADFVYVEEAAEAGDEPAEEAVDSVATPATPADQHAASPLVPNV